MFGRLPYITVVLDDVVMVFSTKVAGANREIQVETLGYGNGITVFKTTSIVGPVPYRSSRNSTDLSSSAECIVVCEDLTIYA